MAAVASIETDAMQAVPDPPQGPQKHAAALTPPTSEDLDKHNDASSDLTELDLLDEKEDAEEDDIGEVEPDHYYGDGKIPVFKPTMDQFRSFPKFIEKVDKYGMKSGIIKVIPPKEWRDSLPALDDAVKTIKVKNPITQEFVGTHGTYTQQNIEKQRSYNLPQWKALTEESNHQPPAKRGERRRNLEATKAKTRTATPLASGEKRKPGRPRRSTAKDVEPEAGDNAGESGGDNANREPQVPPTPTSPEDDTTTPAGKEEQDTDTTPAKKRGKPGRPRKASPKPKGRQPKATTVAERRKYNITSTADDIDEESFKDFDYRFPEASDFTAERCQELEDVYWKTLNYGTPMYGADMPGSLFDDNCTSWHVGRLENLLDVLGTKVPGVNTTYLYLGMWKATFAWHLEDVDLYSINYIHFGAPKQWYSISQEDARRFEAAMKTIWPTDAKHCDQFLRHKTYLISPEKLKSQFNIKVNKLVHNEGEFVITYPYGYHSGFNLGYNCAESVNFATESWLNYGRIAKKCNCEADSVWVDVAEIERKLRGEPTPEYYEETDDEDEGADPAQLATPPPNKKGRGAAGKRKRDSKVQPGPKKTKKIRILVKIPSKMPCVLCPNEAAYDTLLPTDNGQKAHRLCALYTPETYITEVDGKEVIRNVAGIDKSRLDLKCIFCRSKRGSCFQCSEKKCTRAYHATCAIGAGVQIDAGPVPTWDAEGTEFWCEGFDFRCRFHRPKRAKQTTMEALEGNRAVRSFARNLKINDTVQAQYFGSDAFGGVVLENRPEEQSVLVKVLPDGDMVEIEWKWILVLDPADSKRPKPSPDAKKLPETLLHDSAINTENRKDGVPEMGEPFHDPSSGHKWEEWNAAHWREVQNPTQKQVDLSKSEQLWHYLGKTSTEAKAQFTHDLAIQVHNTKSIFLDTVRPPPKPVVIQDRRQYPAPYPSGANFHALNASMSAQRQFQQHRPLQQAPVRMDKPYEYKPKVPMASILNPKEQSPLTYHSPHYGPTGARPPLHSTPIQFSSSQPDARPYPRTAPEQYHQPPSAQAIANDPLRAGYPYQQSTYTQIHGPQSPVDPNFAHLLAKSRGSSPGSVGHHRTPSISSQRPPSQQQHGPDSVAYMQERPPSVSDGSARANGHSVATLATSPPLTSQYQQWNPPVKQVQSPWALPPPQPAPMAPMMGGALPGQVGYRNAVPVQPTVAGSRTQMQHTPTHQGPQNVESRSPALERADRTGEFSHIKQLLSNYHDARLPRQAHPPGLEASWSSFRPSPPHSERADPSGQVGNSKQPPVNYHGPRMYSQAHPSGIAPSQSSFGVSPPHSERAYTATPPSKPVYQHEQETWRPQSPARPEYSPLSESGGPAQEQDSRTQQWR